MESQLRRRLFVLQLLQVAFLILFVFMIQNQKSDLCCASGRESSARFFCLDAVIVDLDCSARSLFTEGMNFVSVTSEMFVPNAGGIKCFQIIFQKTDLPYEGCPGETTGPQILVPIQTRGFSSRQTADAPSWCRVSMRGIMIMKVTPDGGIPDLNLFASQVSCVLNNFNLSFYKSEHLFFRRFEAKKKPPRCQSE